MRKPLNSFGFRPALSGTKQQPGLGCHIFKPSGRSDRSSKSFGLAQGCVSESLIEILAQKRLEAAHPSPRTMAPLVTSAEGPANRVADMVPDGPDTVVEFSELVFQRNLKFVPNVSAKCLDGLAMAFEEGCHSLEL